MKVTRTGTVTLKIMGPTGQPYYTTARVEQYEDGSVVHYPPNAALPGWNRDGACDLPASLIDIVKWD